MKRIVLLSALLAVLPMFLQAQFNYTQIHNQQGHNLGASQLPSLLGDDMRTGEIHLLNLYGGFANNFVSAYDLQQLSQSGKLSNEYIDNFLAKTPN